MVGHRYCSDAAAAAITSASHRHGTAVWVRATGQ